MTEDSPPRRMGVGSCDHANLSRGSEVCRPELRGRTSVCEGSKLRRCGCHGRSRRPRNADGTRAVRQISPAAVRFVVMQDLTPEASLELETPEPMIQNVEASQRLVKPKIRGVFHEVGFYVAAAVGVALIVTADPGPAPMAGVIFASCVAFCFCASAVYHRPTRRPPAPAWLAPLAHP